MHFNQHPEKWFGQHQLIELMEDFGIYTHAITPTLKQKYSPRMMKREAEKATKIFLRFVNSTYFGKLYNRGKKSLPVCTFYETKLFGENPHLHMAIGSPEGVSYEEFKVTLIASKERIDLFNQQFDVRPFNSNGWLTYISKGGIEGMIPTCCSRGI